MSRRGGARIKPSVLRDVQQGALFGKNHVFVQKTGAEELRDGAIHGQHYAHVRNVLQIPFDDSIDSLNPLECFFQMPTDTLQIKKARVWVQRKAFRQYVQQSVPSGGSGTSSSEASHTHSVTLVGSTTGPGDVHSHSPVGTDATSSGPGPGPLTHAAHGGHDAHDSVADLSFLSHDHQATVPGSANTAAHSHATHVSHTEHSDHGGTHSHSHSHSLTSESSHAHSYNAPGITSSGGSSHSHTTPDHTHILTAGIFETAAAGTLSLKVADDGVTYGANIVSGVTAITDQDITSQLTKTAGDKRIKIEGTGLMRVQILLLLDLIVAVPPL